MQCFTRPSLLPRTVYMTNYRAPPDKFYNSQRKPFNPEPDHNGRMTNPDAYPLIPPFYQGNLNYHPVDGTHREKNLQKMLCYINQVNFTTSRDARIRSLHSRVPYREHFRHSNKMPATTASTYVHHGKVKVTRIVTEDYEKPAVSIAPSAYRYRPYQGSTSKTQICQDSFSPQGQRGSRVEMATGTKGMKWLPKLPM